MPEHFSDYQNQIIYRALSGMAKDGIATIDTFGIMEYIKHDDEASSESISKNDLDELIDISNVLTRNSVKDYEILVSNVYDVAFRREMLSKLGECREILLNPESEDAKKQIYCLVDGVMTSYSFGNDLEQYTELVDKYWGEIEARQATGYAGIPFKFPALNDYVTIEKGELIIFGAQQKVGKSIMLLNCAVDLMRKGYSVLYIDSELSSRMFTSRLIAHLTGIEYRNLTSGRYTREEKEKIRQAIEWIKNQRFNHIYLPVFEPDTIYMLVKQTMHKFPLDVLIIDYFKSSGNETDAFQTYTAMGKCTDLVKNEIAGSMNIAAIGAAQATSTNKLADSAKIARNASTIVMLMDKTPEEIQEDGVECGNKKMVVTINRNGMQHTQGEYIDLMFDGNHISYEQAPKQHIPNIPY